MLAGHYSAAFLAKSADPSVPLWVLALAVQAVDVVWALLVLAGVEHLRIDHSLASNPLDLYDMPYTHSLLGTFVWAGIAFALARSWLGRTRSAAIVAAAVASHWLLDWLVHRPDMTLFGVEPKLGLALWDRPYLALVLELALLLGSVWLYLRTNRPAAGTRRRALILVAVLVAVQIETLVFPPVSGPMGTAATALFLFLAVAWGAARVERGREA